MNKQEIINEKLKDLLEDTDLSDYPYEDHETPEECIEYLRESINQEEIIYYSRAIEYLAENDASLIESIGIAVDYGYDLESINSELLATLLYQRELMEELANMESSIEEIYADADDWEIEQDQE